MSNQETKTVDYFGHKIEIPIDHKYVAMDKGGNVFSYKYSPIPIKSQGVWLSSSYTKDMRICTKLRAADLKGRLWHESLCKYEVPQSKEPGIKKKVDITAANYFYENKKENTMKKIKTRTVEYYGVEIEIPANHNFVATDANGEVYSYPCKPTIPNHDSRWCFRGEHDANAEYIPYYLNKDCNWKESLREYPSLKPSTAELKSERAKQFAEWFDAKFKIEDLGVTLFDPTSPSTVLNHVKCRTSKSNTEVKAAVIKHIDEYTVPQYGDYPNDNVEKWSKQYCIDMVAKYKAREGTSQRSEGYLDYWKMMHYSQLADCKPANRAEESMLAEMLTAFNWVSSYMTPKGKLHINAVDRKGESHSFEFDYRDELLSGRTEAQAKLELVTRLMEWVDTAKAKS